MLRVYRLNPLRPLCLSGAFYSGPRAYSTISSGVNHTSRLLKKTHILCCARPISRQRTTRVRFRLSSFARLGSEVFFEQPAIRGFFNMLETISLTHFPRTPMEKPLHSVPLSTRLRSASENARRFTIQTDLIVFLPELPYPAVTDF